MQRVHDACVPAAFSTDVKKIAGISTTGPSQSQTICNLQYGLEEAMQTLSQFSDMYESTS